MSGAELVDAPVVSELELSPALLALAETVELELASPSVELDKISAETPFVLVSVSAET